MSEHTEARSAITEVKPHGPMAFPYGHFPGDTGMSEGPPQNVLNRYVLRRVMSPEIQLPLPLVVCRGGSHWEDTRVLGLAWQGI